MRPQAKVSAKDTEYKGCTAETNVSYTTYLSQKLKVSLPSIQSYDVGVSLACVQLCLLYLVAVAVLVLFTDGVEFPA
jgi:hypothetical protein